MFVLLVGAMLFAQGFGPAPQPAPIQTTTKVEVTVSPPPIDPQATAEASAWGFQGIIVNVVSPTLVKWVDGLLDVPDFIRTTPPGLTYGNEAVKGLAGQVRLVALGLVALAIFAVGVAHALGQQPSFGRLVFGVVLSVGDLVWWQIGIDLNNAITNGIASPPIRDIVKPHLTLPAITSDPSVAFGPAMLVIVYALVALLLLISLAFRLGLIDILIAVGPLALLCYSTDESSPLAQTYTRLAVGTLFSQVLIVIALRLSPVLATLVAGIGGTILGIVVLLLARQMPSLLASAGRNGSTGRTVMMLVLRRVLLRH